MAGPPFVANVGIILGALIGVLDHQRDRRAGGDLTACALVFKDAGQDFHFIGFAPLGDMARGAGLSQIQPGLDVAFRQRDPRRAAVNDAAERGTVAFAPAGEAEQVTEGIMGHGKTPGRNRYKRSTLGGLGAGVTRRCCRRRAPIWRTGRRGRL